MSGVILSDKPLRQVNSVKELLVNSQAKQQLAAVAATHMRPERMLRLMANAIRTTPQLGECDPLSLLGAMMTCASLGIEANTPLGHAYLLPFKNTRKNITEVQLILGYKGMIDLARRSGHIVNIHGDVVYEADEFSFEYGSDQHLRHRPKGKRKNPLYAYCHAKLTDGEAFVVLPWDEVMAIRDASQGYKTAVKFGKKDSPWIAHVHEMAAKTAVRALFKYLPISIEMDGGKLGDALTVDDTKADYRAFAMDPTQGVTIEGEADAVEEDGAIEGEVQQIEQVQTQRANFDQQEQRQERQADPAPRKQQPADERQKPAGRRDSGPYAEGAPKLSEKRREAQAEPEQATMFDQKQAAPGADPWCQQFLQDVKDVGYEQAADLHLTQLREVQNADPEKHYWLMEQVQLIEDAARD